MDVKISCNECGESLDVQKVYVGDAILCIEIEVSPCNACVENEYEVGKEEGIDSCNQED